MTPSYRVVLTAAAKATGVPYDDLRQAAVAAVSSWSSQEIAFKAVKVHGKQFALATRIIVEVDFFPNRVPNITLPERSHGSITKRPK